ncbi:flagellar filament capping protein FliD [Thermosediminibacter oceani]|uniref:Flagellar hook-associated protein 2 n=1 Tax=Thermosediminibacter oceani (strain ATCC BAA-1034 / DSM 16646 / JW/IW-1228P) TaxID=555079 RepID=D9RY97_THEOJ|nr:flagellar filament capping protein FliD [Thermosediminibacter oceani]ADL08321.1 flagellar hook-associated 2 domain protein [Thermosediminibacter oceani DSM 16646]
MPYNTLRIGGLASGIDIDQIISDLMKVERMRVDKLYQQRQILEWQRQDYRDINLKLKALYDNVFNMKLQGTYLKYKATGTLSSGASSDVYFTAVAGSTAMAGEYTVKVVGLADYAKIESGAPITKELQGSGIVSNLTDTINISPSNNKFKISVDGIIQEITLGSGSYTINTLVDHIQSKLDASDSLIKNKVKVGYFYDSVAGNYRLTFAPADNYNHNIKIVLNADPSVDALGTLGFSDGATYTEIDPAKSIKDQRLIFKNDPFGGNENLTEFKFTIYNGDKSETFTFNVTDSINYILSKISSSENIKVTAYYDPLTDKVVFKSKDTGANTSIKIVNETGHLFGDGSTPGAFNIASGEAAWGTNSTVVINGVTMENPTNSFTLNGIQFTLKQAMPDTETATLRIESDIDGVVESIKNFINLYNDTIDAINKKLSEERYRDYPPLTDAQKKEMTEDEIKLWEEKAKSGLLRSDPLLSGIVSKMREAIYTPISGLPAEFDSLYDIGITTGSYIEKGKLYLDENKLRQALSKDLNAVMRLFTNTNETDSAQNGIAVKLYDILKSGMKSITDKAGGGDFEIFDNSLLAKKIRDINERIDSMEEQLKEIEDRYWRQFTEMEKAISAMNQQSLWLASQMGLYGSQS